MPVKYSVKNINSRFKLYSVENGIAKNSFTEDVCAGLNSSPKTLQPKYFYDKTGSELFERICETPEYYVTRTESAILKEHSEEIAQADNNFMIVELGSGSSVKTRYIINSVIKHRGSVTYIPVDVSDILIKSGKTLLDDFEGLDIEGIIGEYEESLQLVAEIFSEPKLIMFLGSSIGNFDLPHAQVFMNKISASMNKGDKLLIGFDLVKDDDVLNAAYNDKDGITAEFNLNLIKRIKAELGCSVNPDNFQHKAFFNSAESRIEMHLISICDQSFRLNGSGIVSFKKGESVHTENSYKFTDEMIEDLAKSSGLKINNIWKDSRNYFGLCLMSK